MLETAAYSLVVLRSIRSVDVGGLSPRSPSTGSWCGDGDHRRSVVTVLGV